jgi:hypothetical protein
MPWKISIPQKLSKSLIDFIHPFPIILLCFLVLLPPNTHVQIPNHPADDENEQHAAEDGQGLPEAGEEGVVVCHNQFAIPELIDDVDGSQSEGRAAEGVHEGAVETGGVGDEWDGSFEADVPGRETCQLMSYGLLGRIALLRALRQYHTGDDTLVLHALGLPRPLEERHLEHIAVGRPLDLT